MRYALRATDPTDAKTKETTQHGANRLAAVGLSVLTVTPRRRGPEVRLELLGDAGRAWRHRSPAGAPDFVRQVHEFHASRDDRPTLTRRSRRQPRAAVDGSLPRRCRADSGGTKSAASPRPPLTGSFEGPRAAVDRVEGLR